MSSVSSSSRADEVLKLVVRRSRPIYAASFLHSYSFPSGHAMGSMIAYGMLAWLIGQFGVPGAAGA